VKGAAVATAGEEEEGSVHREGELLLFWVEFRLVIWGILILFGLAGDPWGSQFSRLEGVQLGKTWNFVLLMIILSLMCHALLN
jgi:hypothetical protein